MILPQPLIYNVIANQLRCGGSASIWASVFLFYGAYEHLHLNGYPIRAYIYIYGVILSNIRVNYCSVRTMLQAKIVASLREAQRLSRAKNVSNLGRCKKNQCKKFFPRQQNFLQNLAQLLLGRQLFTFNICNIAEDTISHDFSLILTTNTHHIIETSIFSEYVTHAPTYVPESREKKYRRFGFNLV